MPQFLFATRVQIICPCGGSEQFVATNDIISYLKTRRNVQFWGGFTHSALENPPFIGYFWHSRQNGARGWWEADRNVLIFIDIPERVPEDVFDFFSRVMAEMRRFYEAAGSPQKSFWITIQPIYVLQEQA